jgi:non-specific serine/threonine protein kinase/serine/threonine-protein kinase
VGAYSIVELIAAGGMGEVYRAEQEHPIRRTVALKLVKLGMDSRQVLARFQSERQTLALMQHPNVAAVYDAGVSETGRPYFVMEYVPGRTITEHCDENHLTLPQRLELFIQACEAVQHAHQKTIVHRDLKPGNILVTQAGQRPLVKVIDFGVAKAMSPELSGGMTVTRQDQLLGTPEYMSPEQTDFAGNRDDVDTRSDIYSLGVVLYELLIGARPFDSDTWRSSSFDEIRNVIRNVDPPRPSTRLSSLDASLAEEVARRRQLRLDALHRELRHELEWIPLKALRKDRSERYRTAAELADDIRNYLEHRPLIAGPQSRAYQLRVFLRRNRRSVLAASAVALAILIGATVSGALAIKLKRSADVVRAEQSRTLDALKNAESANANSSAVIKFLTADVIGSADPAVTKGQPLSVQDALQKASLIVGEKFKDNPLVEAAVRNALGITFKAVGRPDLARHHVQIALEQRRRLLGPDHTDTIDSLHNLAAMLADDGNLSEAEPLMREALERSRRNFGDGEPATLRTLNNLAALLYHQGKFAEAEPLFRDGLAQFQRTQGQEHPETLAAINNLASVLQVLGKLTEAEQLYRQALQVSRRTLGDDHPDTLLWLNNLAAALKDQQRFSEAEPLYRDAMERRRRVLGDEHPDTMVSIDNLAELLVAQQRFPDAEVLRIEELERLKQKPAFEARQRDSIQRLVDLYESWGKTEQAAEWRAKLPATRQSK